MADSGRSCLLAATPGFYPVFPVDGKFLVNLGLLVESNINNDLTTKNDPNATFLGILGTAGMHWKQSFTGQALAGNLRPIPVNQPCPLNDRKAAGIFLFFLDSVDLYQLVIPGKAVGS